MMGPEHLHQHGSWLHRIVGSLVSGKVPKDDVVQETWLAALEGLPEKLRSPRAWLWAVARNKALRMRLHEDRRTKRERKVAGGVVLPSSEELALQKEAKEKILRALAGLEEPVRKVLELTFFENLQQKEIAERLGISVRTVKRYLRTGLESLRRKLDAEYGDRKAWMFLFLPLAEMEGASLGTGVSVGVKMAAAVAACVVTAAAVFIESDPRNEDLGPVAGPFRPAPLPPGRTEIPEIPTERPSGPPPLAAFELPPGVALGGERVMRLLDLADRGKPLAAVTIGFPGTDLPPVQTDREGRFEAKEGPSVLELRLPGYTPVGLGLNLNHGFEWILFASPCGGLAGQVLDGQGSALEGVEVQFWLRPVDLQVVPMVFSALLPLGRAHKPARTDAEGTFRLRNVPLFLGSHLRLRRGGVEIWVPVEEVQKGKPVWFTHSGPSGDDRWAGLVLDEEGRPIRGATVGLGPNLVTTDAEGAFQIPKSSGVQPEDALIVSKAEFQPLVLPNSGGVPAWPIRLRRGPLRIVGTIVDSEGHPLQGYRVVLGNGTAFGKTGPVLFYNKDQNRTAESVAAGDRDPVPTGEDGGFEIGGLADRSYTLIAYNLDLLRFFLSGPIPAGAEGVEIRQPPEDRIFRSVRGRLTDREGAPLPGASVSVLLFAPESHSLRLARGTNTDKAGLFDVPMVPLGPASLCFSAGEGGGFMDRIVALSPDRTDEELEVVLERRCTLVLEGGGAREIDAVAVLDGAGNPLPLVFQGGPELQLRAKVWRSRAAGNIPAFWVSEEGRTLVGYQGSNGPPREILRVSLSLRPGETNRVNLK